MNLLAALKSPEGSRCYLDSISGIPARVMNSQPYYTAANRTLLSLLYLSVILCVFYR